MDGRSHIPLPLLTSDSARVMCQMLDGVCPATKPIVRGEARDLACPGQKLSVLPEAVSAAVRAGGEAPLPCVLAFLQLGGAPDALDASGRSLLHCAAATDNVSLTRVLIRLGASLELRNGLGATPLYMAAFAGHERVVTRLLRAKADASARCGEGLSPLMVACRIGRSTKVVRALLEHGAEVDDVDDHGGTVASHAAAGGKMSIANELRRHFTKQSVARRRYK